MDEIYIMMCEKSKDIQKSWVRTAGDMFFLADEAKLEGKTRTYILGCHWRKCLGCKYEAGHGIWIPRQSQLQEIYIQSLPKDEQESINIAVVMLDDFQDWVLNDCSGLDWSYKTKVLMEQLWLAFLMKEKYNKIWNGKEWIT